MSRRRLRVVCSSDEEEDLRPPPAPPLQQQQEDDIDDLIIDDIETDFQTVNLNSTIPTPNTSNSTSASATSTSRYNYNQIEPIPLDISDDDRENTTVDDSTNNVINSNNSVIEVSESHVHGVLERLGLRLRKEWLDSCLHGLQSSVQGFQRMDDSAKAKLCLGQFLWSDMNYCGAGILPPNLHMLHHVNLKGPFVLQVDEIVNISKCLRERYDTKVNVAPGIKRCLKLSMTDGVQRVFGMEYSPIKDLKVFSPAGLKVAVRNVDIKRGIMLLVAENIEVLGGGVEELEVARQRLVIELNKPPRGRRTRTGIVPPMATRATLAAWPLSTDAASTDSSVNAIPPQASGRQVNIPANVVHRQGFATPSNRNDADPNMSGAPHPQEQVEVLRHTDMPASTSLNSHSQNFETPMSWRNTEPTTLSAVQPPQCVSIPQHVDEPTTEVVASPATPPGIAVTTNHVPEEDVDGAEPNTTSMHMDIDDLSMLDDLEHNFIISRDENIPFTYLASLSAKFAANDEENCVVRGKIKCFLTGVKGFNYKERTTYELQVYVDDGSLISNIFIDHNVVEKRIGYSPQEVTSALESSDSKRASEMKKILKQFQIFLVDFEGTMIVEMSNARTVPAAVEMTPGCPASDALLLLKRVKSLASGQVLNQSHFNPIELSP